MAGSRVASTLQLDFLVEDSCSQDKETETGIHKSNEMTPGRREKVE
jgi:hypothetical protein